ncbi:MAG: Proline--tRNA ligase [Lentisphaerae bacterium ADurb.Bin242]|nr:MAG: Proline--tRNA ligase [Lentisphaerae bacterium ADurb.Bin242]
MKMSQLLGRRIKEDPKDAKTISHKFLVRGGYIRPVSAGIYSILPIGMRILEKIEAIIREEMNRIDGQEVKMPVVLPAELWEESGRYQSVGEELLRFKDRNGKAMLLGMTHEEAVVHLVRTEITSYKQLPVMAYQIQTKYRDEARPRAGLIRVREFTMKDAYSFHASQECLEKYYERAHEAYERIFRRAGLRNVVSIRANSGMMGGNISHEFMSVAECGEDTIFLSPDRKSYKANREIAVSALKFEKSGEELPLEKVHTPGQKTIEEVAAFLGVKPENTGKAVFYADHEGKLIFVMIRGDFEVNESKLQNHLGVLDLKFANDPQILAAGAVPGFASPIGLDPAKVRIVVDPSVAGTSNLVVGANETDYHYRNFNYGRDLKDADVTDIATVREGDPCPVTGQPLLMKRGIEVGNIFQLGTKYSGPMMCNYLDKDGKSHPMIMGCYGIGVGRTMASVVEDSHDDYGPVWPMSITPYQVHLCALNPDKGGVGEAAEKLYDELRALGVEVLFDDRGEKAGFMFSDADLIGIPFRAIVSPKSLEQGKVEFKLRTSRDAELFPAAEAAGILADKVREELKKFDI